MYISYMLSFLSGSWKTCCYICVLRQPHCLAHSFQQLKHHYAASTYASSDSHIAWLHSFQHLPQYHLYPVFCVLCQTEVSCSHCTHVPVSWKGRKRKAILAHSSTPSGDSRRYMDHLKGTSLDGHIKSTVSRTAGGLYLLFNTIFSSLNN